MSHQRSRRRITPKYVPASSLMSSTQLSLPRPKSQATTEKAEEKDSFDEVANMARSAYKIGRVLLGELNVEYKLIENQVLGLLPDWAGATTYSNSVVNYCSQGQTDTTRSGDSIKIQNLMLRGFIASGNTILAFNNPTFVRCVVYWQKNTDVITKVFPTDVGISDGILDFYLKGTTAGALATNAPKDYDLDATSTILYDKTWTISSSTPYHIFNKLIKINRHTQYENNSQNIASGVLRVAFLSNQSNAVSTRPTVSWASRTYFIDN